MRSNGYPGATGASSIEIARRARVELAGVPGHLAASLVEIAFAVPKRDDVSALMAMTASRCSAASVGARS